MPSTPAFDEAYGRLNTQQRAAVDAIEGPVFVIAGPGTGKTQVLTLRIANILRQTDTPPESILALTFTEAAAHEMRERLRRMIGSRALRVRIHTFHGFAEYAIAQYPDHFPRIIGAHIATDAERAEIVDRVLLETPVRHLRPFGDPLYYHPTVTRAISTMKRENVTPEKLEKRIHEAQEAFDAAEGKVHEKGKYVGQMKADFVALQKKIEKTEDLLLVYKAYEAALTEARRYDFEDLILEVVRTLETDEAFRLQVQESLFYILADEHQDANAAQNALLELVSGFHERPNLFIVGDEKQAVYRFQGADLDNVHYFRSKFPDTLILTLVENYRSTQSILDSALALIAASPDERLSRVPLVANSENLAKPITLTVCQTADQELTELASEITTLLEEGTQAGEIAVLVRRNRDVADVARALTRAGIPATGSGEEDLLENRFVRSLIRLLRVAAEPRDELLAGVLTLPAFPLTAADTVRITQFARKEKRTILSILADENALAAAKVQDVASAKALGASIEEMARMASFERPAAVAERALQLSGLLPKALQSSDRAGALGAIRGLLRALEDLSRREHDALVPRALDLLDLYTARGIAISGRGSEDDTRVRVMTVHRSKGREFEYVFIPMLTSQAWSTRKRPEHFYLPDILSGTNELEDERRLLYVGITRAKKHATLSYAQMSSEDRALDPTELLEDINPELVETRVPALDVVSADEAYLTQVAEKRDTSKPSIDDLATLRATLFAQGLSPTAFNNYLQCPWKYFYVNLLRIPEIENKHMLYGTAIHAALKRYADARVDGAIPDTQEVTDAFVYSLERTPLSSREVDELREKGIRALGVWCAEHAHAWPEATRAEISIQAELPVGTTAEGEPELLTIRGALDRMDEMPGGVRVIDYKTGKAKSRNELMGATKDADGNYYRQLTFYKLLLKRTEESQVMQEGVIEFVEPDDKDRIRTEAFEIPDTDVEALEGLIRKAVQEITTLSFWNDPCNEEDCEWCLLRFKG